MQFFYAVTALWAVNPKDGFHVLWKFHDNPTTELIVQWKI